MSTVAERKLVTFLRRLQTGGLDSNPLDYIEKIYSDTPREDVGRTSFPRLQVRELGGTSKFIGIGATDRIYELVLQVIVYVDMDSPFTESDVISFWDQGRNLSPEEAVGAIAYHVSKELGENKATLHADNSHQFILRGNASYTPMGIDNEYFDKLNVFKGSIDLNFYLRN